MHTIISSVYNFLAIFAVFVKSSSIYSVALPNAWNIPAGQHIHPVQILFHPNFYFLRYQNQPAEISRLMYAL
jgi:hypothetical protein